MAIHRTRKTKSLAAQAAAVAVAAPQVIAHRALRMAMAGASPSAGDRKEFRRMGAEKIAVFGESWTAMAMQTFRAQQQLALSCMRSLWFPWLGSRAGITSAIRQPGNVALAILAEGAAPIRRRAVANAKRLARARTR